MCVLCRHTQLYFLPPLYLIPDYVVRALAHGRGRAPSDMHRCMWTCACVRALTHGYTAYVCALAHMGAYMWSDICAPVRRPTAAPPQVASTYMSTHTLCTSCNNVHMHVLVLQHIYTTCAHVYLMRMRMRMRTAVCMRRAVHIHVLRHRVPTHLSACEIIGNDTRQKRMLGTPCASAHETLCKHSAHTQRSHFSSGARSLA